MTKQQTFVILIVIVLVFGFFAWSQNWFKATGTIPLAVVFPTEYKNNDFGFSVSLPESWVGYTSLVTTWEGYSLNTAGDTQTKAETGPIISIRNPLWTTTNPRQDIPVMVFTIQQWNDMQADKFHIGAAPINPNELARNSKYVFALPARYNFAYLPGFEEVDRIIISGDFKAF